MKGRKKVIAICCLFLAGLLGLCGCSSPSSDSAKDRISDELVYESSMELEYAKQFSVDYYKDGLPAACHFRWYKDLSHTGGKRGTERFRKRYHCDAAAGPKSLFGIILCHGYF